MRRARTIAAALSLAVAAAACADRRTDGEPGPAPAVAPDDPQALQDHERAGFADIVLHAADGRCVLHRKTEWSLLETGQEHLWRVHNRCGDLPARVELVDFAPGDPFEADTTLSVDATGHRVRVIRARARPETAGTYRYAVRINGEGFDPQLEIYDP